MQQWNKLVVKFLPAAGNIGIICEAELIKWDAGMLKQIEPYTKRSFIRKVIFLMPPCVFCIWIFYLQSDTVELKVKHN